MLSRTLPIQGLGETRGIEVLTILGNNRVDVQYYDRNVPNGKGIRNQLSDAGCTYPTTRIMNLTASAGKYVGSHLLLRQLSVLPSQTEGGRITGFLGSCTGATTT